MRKICKNVNMKIGRKRNSKKTKTLKKSIQKHQTKQKIEKSNQKRKENEKNAHEQKKMKKMREPEERWSPNPEKVGPEGWGPNGECGSHKMTPEKPIRALSACQGLEPPQFHE